MSWILKVKFGSGLLNFSSSFLHPVITSGNFGRPTKILFRCITYGCEHNMFLSLFVKPFSLVMKQLDNKSNSLFAGWNFTGLSYNRKAACELLHIQWMH